MEMNVRRREEKKMILKILWILPLDKPVLLRFKVYWNLRMDLKK